MIYKNIFLELVSS